MKTSQYQIKGQFFSVMIMTKKIQSELITYFGQPHVNIKFIRKKGKNKLKLKKGNGNCTPMETTNISEILHYT